jgi:beta-glucanase (GH16 family)
MASIKKKSTKKKTKLVRFVIKHNKLIRKYFKKLNKKIHKNSKKFKKSLKKLSRVSLYSSLAFAVLSIVIGGGVGYAYANRSSQGNTPSETVISTNKHQGEALSSVNADGPAQTDSSFANYPSWSQDFATDKSTTLSSNDWEVESGPAQNGNNEAEYYTDSPTNLNISNGALNLTATKQAEPDNYNYASAHVDTDGKVSFLYGRIDITAKVPNGIGTWPAAWFLPANNKYEDLSPSSDSIRYLNGGEIDLMEEVGFQPNVEYGIVHTLADLSNPNGVGTYNTETVANNNTVYSTYSLLWTPTTITFEVNNVPFYTYTKAAGADYKTWPFDQPFYLILNLAIGGSWGGSDTAAYPNGIDNSALPATLSIKSIYYYPYVGS